MRFTSTTPSILALAASALLATGAWHPKMLQPSARRAAYPAAGVALLTAVLLRPRKVSREDRDLLDPMCVVEPPFVQTSEGVEESEEKGTGDVFGASRREWGEITTPDCMGKSMDRPGGANVSTTASASSSVYSYSYKRSAKREKRQRSENADDRQDVDSIDPKAQDIRSAFAYMRDEFSTSPNNIPNNIGDREEKVASRETLRNDWECGWGEEDQVDEHGAWQSTSLEDQVDRSHETEEHPPRPISSAKLMRHFVRAPTWVISEILLPAVDVVALVWFDLKVWLLRIPGRQLQGEDRYFLPALKQKRIHAEEEDVSFDELSEEEKQIEQIQATAKKAVKGIEGTVRKIFKDIL